MPGKMTVLDRLIKEGRVKQSPFREMKLHGEFTDPMIKARANQQLAGNKLIKLDPSWKTPERQVYQQGVDEVQRKKIRPILDEQRAVYDEQANLQDKFDEAYEDARERWMAEVEDAVPTSFNMEYGFEPFELQFEAPSFDMREYWPGYADDLGEFSRINQEQLNRLEDIDERLDRWRGLKGHMMAQTMTPRYRNYQRAMQQRAANMAMGRDLSRRYAIAYNNLLRRGLTPAEARMYMREYFGGR